jgi:hypothetical protein
MIFRNIAVLLLVLFPTLVFSQFYDTGQDPHSIKWREINTTHFRVIYQDSIEAQAQKLANALEYSYKISLNSLAFYPEKIDVVLHNQSLDQKAGAYMCPRRLEIYPITRQDATAQGWNEQIVLQGAREVVQMSMFNQGVTKVFSYILGEVAPTALIYFYLPFWFMYGDPKSDVTAVTDAGSGRTPDFYRQIRAQLVEIGPYKYSKAFLGSYNDYIPSSYELGYFMTGYGRVNYGTKIWQDAINTTAKVPVPTFKGLPFTRGMKKTSKLNGTTLYFATVKYFDSLWKAEDIRLKPTDYKAISKIRKKEYTSYYSPVYLTDTSYVAIKLGYDDIGRIVKINGNGKEKRITTPGELFYNNLSFSNNMLTWIEHKNDVRWGNRSYGIIKIKNLKKGRVKTLSRKTKYSSIALNNEGSTIVASESDIKNNSFLTFIDVKTKKVTKRIAAPDGETFINPVFSHDNNIVVCVMLCDKGKYLAVIDDATGKIIKITEPTNREIGKVDTHGNFIIYSAGYEDISNLYAINITTLELFKITSSRFGASDPCIDHKLKKIVYTDYNNRGARLVEISFETTNWISFKPKKDSVFVFADALSQQAEYKYHYDNVPQKAYPTKSYKRFLHSLNPHSWGPVAVDIDNISLNPGVSVLSQNLLNNTIIGVGYQTKSDNSIDKKGMFFGRLQYKGWYPTIEIGLYRYDKQKLVGGTINYTTRKLRAEMTIGLPFELSGGKWQRSLTPSVSYNLLGVKGNQDVPYYLAETGNAHTLDFSLVFENTQKLAYKDILPPWGQKFKFYFKTTPYVSNNMEHGTYTSGEMSLYFPGFFRHHSINIYNGFQYEDNYVLFDSEIRRPYAFGSIYDFTEPYLNSLLIEYKFPWLYPDLGGTFLYVKRFYSSVYYNYIVGYDPNINFDNTSKYHFYPTLGCDVLMSFHFLSISSPWQFGLRFNWRMNDKDKPYTWNVLFAMKIGQVNF